MRYSNRAAAAAEMLLVAAAALAVAGCEALAPQAPPPVATTAPPPVVAPQVKPPATTGPVKPPATVEPGRPPSAIDAAALRPAGWSDLPGWRSDDPAAAWSAFLASCRALAQQDLWRGTCGAAQAMSSIGRDTARQFFETNLRPFQVINPEGSAEGLITGYYEPLVRGSRKPSARYRYPVFGVPDDLLIVDLAEAYPELKGLQSARAARRPADRSLLRPCRDRGRPRGARGPGNRVGGRSGGAVLSAGPGLGAHRARHRRNDARGLCRAQRLPLPLDRPAARRARRAAAREGFHAGHQGVGACQPGEADGAAQPERALRFLPRASGRPLRARPARWASPSRPAAASRSIRGSSRSGRPSTSPRRGRLPTSRSTSSCSPRTPAARSAGPCARITSGASATTPPARPGA